MGNEASMRKDPSTGNPRPRPRFYLCRDGDGFEGGDGDDKIIFGPTLPCPIVIPR